MKKIFLIHQDIIQHYRVSIYNYLTKYLSDSGYQLNVISNGIEIGSPYKINFKFIEVKLNVFNIININKKINPEAVIFFVNLKNLYLFPLLFYFKFKGIKIIYWGHGLDLQDKDNLFKNSAYRSEYVLFDGLLLYAGHLKKFIAPKHHKKIFIANNTLNTTIYNNIKVDKKNVKAKYGISTSRNIICMGRMQKRKRIDDLINAFKKLKTNDVGLILAGPDPEGLLSSVNHEYIYKPGPVYGDDAIRLLSVCDLYCMPGPIGLSIVDAFYCSLPIITENVQHGPEIMYFKDEVNGFMVEEGDVNDLAAKLAQLLSDYNLHRRMAGNAKNTISTNGSIDTMCEGFVNVLNYTLKAKQ